MYVVHTNGLGQKEFVFSMIFGRPNASMNLGTVDTKADLDRFEIPVDALDDDFIFVEDDES